MCVFGGLCQNDCFCLWIIFRTVTRNVLFSGVNACWAFDKDNGRCSHLQNNYAIFRKGASKRMLNNHFIRSVRVLGLPRILFIKCTFANRSDVCIKSVLKPAFFDVSFAILSSVAHDSCKHLYASAKIEFFSLSNLSSYSAIQWNWWEVTCTLKLNDDPSL